MNKRKYINILTNIYPFYLLKKNRELYVHKEITFLQKQFPKFKFFFVDSFSAILYGNFNFLLWKFISKTFPKSILSKNPKCFYLIRNFNYVPLAEIRRKKIDVLYAHEFFPLNLSKETIPIVFDTRFPDDTSVNYYGYDVSYARKAELWFKKFCIDRSSLVTLTTPEDAERLVEYLPNAEKKVRIVPFYLPRLEPINRGDVINKHRENLVRLLFVGNDGYRKGLDILLKVLDKYFSFFIKKNIIIYIVSNFRDKPHLKCETRKLIDRGLPLKIFSNLKWEEVQKLMRRAHIFIFPTRADTYGLVLVEAMANGMAVITSTNSPQRWIVEYGKSGLCIPCDQEYLLFDSLKQLIIQKYYRTDLALKGYSRFMNVFYHKVVGEKLKSVFEEAAERFASYHT